MTKPVIVNRVTKGSPLTTAEHDANFTNLQNATVGLRAGSAGTTVTADLNGVITLVAGSGVTFTGDDTAKTITVTASASDILGLNDITIGSDTGSDTVLRSEANSLTIRSGLSDVIGTDEVARLVLTPTGTISLEVSGTPSRIDLNSKLVKLGPMTDEAGTYPTMLQLGNSAGTGPFSLTAANGMIYYDTLSNNFRGYGPSGWEVFLTAPEVAPAFSAYPSTAQTIASSGVLSKVNFGTEEYDTNSNFASSRFTPSVAGYYQFDATVRLDGGGPGTGECMIVLFKNGSEYKRGWNSSGTAFANDFFSMSVNCQAYANGSSDYFEVYIQQVSGGSRTTSPYANISFFQGCLIKAA